MITYYILFNNRIDIIKSLNYLVDELKYSINYNNITSDCLKVKTSTKTVEFSQASSGYLMYHLNPVEVITGDLNTVKHFIK